MQTYAKKLNKYKFRSPTKHTRGNALGQYDTLTQICLLWTRDVIGKKACVCRHTGTAHQETSA